MSRSKKQFPDVENALRKRSKELFCHYGLCQIVETPDITLGELYRQVANLMPQGFQYPDIACCRLVIDDKEFTSDNYQDSKWKLSADIKSNKETLGKLEICYLKEKPQAYEGPFLKEERLLIDAFAERLGRITERFQTNKSLMRLNRELRDLARKMQLEKEEKRKELAREIHDVLGQKLTLLKMDLSWLQNKLGDSDQALKKKTTQMMKTVGVAIQDLRSISMELRPKMLDDFGICAAIEWQLEEFQKSTGIQTKFSCSDSIVLNPNCSISLFRILQEALTNVIRHANATKVDVSLCQSGSNLEYQISDDGKGIPPKRVSDHKAIGLIGIRERVYSLGGKCRIEGISGKGTTISISIPLRSSNGEQIENPCS